jgi:hypothetical protein
MPQVNSNKRKVAVLLGGTLTMEAQSGDALWELMQEETPQ